jgi:hypothetical protein
MDLSGKGEILQVFSIWFLTVLLDREKFFN